MCDKWEVGDLAECLASPGRWVFLWNNAEAPGPVGGEINKVTKVGYIGDYLCLTFAERYGPRNDYVASCFRKLKPPANNAEKVECEQLLDFIKVPVRETEDA